MTINDDINALPISVEENTTNHLNNHQTIHKALQNHEMRLDGDTLAQVTLSKNLYNPSMDTLGYYVAGVGSSVPAGDPFPLSGYRVTDFIPVTPGETYAMSIARHWAFYETNKAYISDSWEQSQPAAPTVVTAPLEAAYMRMSYFVSTYTPENVQIEKGSVHTSYEPYIRTLDPSIKIQELESRPTTTQVQELVDSTVTLATNNLARVIPSKNLYNPDLDILDAYIANGNVYTYEGYRTSYYIPVEPGESYTAVSARHVNFYDSDLVYVTGSWSEQSPFQPTTVLAPEGAVYMRVSYSYANVSPIAQQIEKGDTSTSYQSYQKVLDPEIVVYSDMSPGSGSVQVTRSGDVVTVASDLGGQQIIQEITLGMGRNSVMNFSRTQYGDMTHALSDDVAPIRTQQATVGANHGYPYVSRWTSTSHDKSTADIGSEWTDGNNTYRIIDLDSDGALWVGREPTINSTGEAVGQSSNPVADLTHVSGATNTGPIDQSSRSTGQLAPWVQRRRTVVEMDGQHLEEGNTRGNSLVIRESYEILDYGVIWDWVHENIGSRYVSTYHKAAVGVDIEWVFYPGGKTRHRTRLWEITPTRLYACGFLQSNAMPGDITRYIPGVGVVGGLNWSSGVPLSSLTTSLLVKSDHLDDPRHPPTVLVDQRPDLGVAVAVNPWSGVSESATRLASTPANLWDLRSSKKIYPTVVNNTAPGWGYIEVEGIRAYLTPDEATAIVTDADPISAWVTLNQMSGVKTC